MPNSRYGGYQYETSPRKLKPEYKPNKKEDVKKKSTTINKNKVNKKNKKKKHLKPQTKIVTYVVLGFVILLAISYRNSLITERFSKKEQLKSDLAVIEKENQQLEVNIQNSLNLSNIEKAAKEEIYNNLLAEGFEVIEPQYTKKMYEDAMLSGSHNMQVILYTTEDFQYSSEGLASIEKAFVDLYFAITRNGYPLSLQELVRIYQNLSRLGNIDKKKLITVASRRNIQYDIRFIVENRFITDSAIEFGKILRREE